jgi:hypothetical protein
MRVSPTMVFTGAIIFDTSPALLEMDVVYVVGDFQTLKTLTKIVLTVRKYFRIFLF